MRRNESVRSLEVDSPALWEDQILAVGDGWQDAPGAQPTEGLRWWTIRARSRAPGLTRARTGRLIPWVFHSREKEGVKHIPCVCVFQGGKILQVTRLWREACLPSGGKAEKCQSIIIIIYIYFFMYMNAELCLTFTLIVDLFGNYWLID